MWWKKLVLILAAIGAINWGLVGAGVGDIIELILGAGSITTILYIIVGVCGIYALVKAIK